MVRFVISVVSIYASKTIAVKALSFTSAAFTVARWLEPYTVDDMDVPLTDITKASVPEKSPEKTNFALLARGKRPW